MRDQPSARELLHIARAALLEEILDALPEEYRYTARMAARAMAIAVREAEAGDTHVRREIGLLGELYGESRGRETGTGLYDRLGAMNRRFAKDIRAGQFDGACAMGVRALLLEQVRARLRISNPGYLETWGLD